MKSHSTVAMLFLIVSFSAFAAGTAGKEDTEVKALSGISIVGNNETPKSLYIVPWKSSEVGMETKLNSSLLNEGMVPVDRDVFKRELDFYEASNAN